MRQILVVLKHDLVFEVMLNAYMYEGHIWYEETGIGMKRLITTTKKTVCQTIQYLKLGIMLFIKLQIMQ